MERSRSIEFFIPLDVRLYMMLAPITPPPMTMASAVVVMIPDVTSQFSSSMKPLYDYLCWVRSTLPDIRIPIGDCCKNWVVGLGSLGQILCDFYFHLAFFVSTLYQIPLLSGVDSY